MSVIDYIKHFEDGHFIVPSVFLTWNFLELNCLDVAHLYFTHGHTAPLSVLRFGKRLRDRHHPLNGLIGFTASASTWSSFKKKKKLQLKTCKIIHCNEATLIFRCWLKATAYFHPLFHERCMLICMCSSSVIYPREEWEYWGKSTNLCQSDVAAGDMIQLDSPTDSICVWF